MIQKVMNARESVEQSEMRQRWRWTRMRAMLERVALLPGAQIVDLGGTAEMWQLVGQNYHVTLVNLQHPSTWARLNGGFTYVEHDACDLRDVFDDRAFDFVFSNSTIEHVGDESCQERFAREVWRLAPAYWVQTPSSKFPMEVHTWVPFYWKLPRWVRDRLMRSWKRRLPDWSEMVEGTRILTRQRMENLFPDGQCYIETLLGLEKSYAFYLPVRSEPRGGGTRDRASSRPPGRAASSSCKT
jgi:hypothetical protein